MTVYIMSDVHGLKGRYDHMMQTICLQEDDVLYVLGDVIDRGDDGIRILQDIMKHENIKMLLGNHEYMMSQYYQAISGEIADDVEGKVVINRWLANHCEPTRRQFESLTMEEQSAILTYIRGLPLAYNDVEVLGKRYYLVHGYPRAGYEKAIIYRKDIEEHGNCVEDFIWNRVEYAQTFFDDRCVILGHTPTLFLQKKHPYEIWTAGQPITTTKLLNIDCGCAANNASSQLACLRLDDLKVFYF